MNPHVNLSKLLALRSIRHDPIISALENAILLGENGMQERNECCSRLITTAENLGLKGNLLSRYLLHVIIYRSNIVSEIMERTGLSPGNSLRHIFYRDIALLHPLLITPTSNFLGEKILDDYEPTKKTYDKTEDFLLPWLEAANSTEDYAEALLTFYARYGCGDIAAYAVFHWDESKKRLCGIAHFECLQMKDLIGYQRQKEQLIQNTRAFVQGKPANHVLLVGARGTGKSSAVKALVGEFEDNSLRLVQVTKEQLRMLCGATRDVSLSSFSTIFRLKTPMPSLKRSNPPLREASPLAHRMYVSMRPPTVVILYARHGVNVSRMNSIATTV